MRRATVAAALVLCGCVTGQTWRQAMVPELRALGCREEPTSATMDVAYEFDDLNHLIEACGHEFVCRRNPDSGAMYCSETLQSRRAIAARAAQAKEDAALESELQRLAKASGCERARMRFLENADGIAIDVCGTPYSCTAAGSAPTCVPVATR